MDYLLRIDRKRSSFFTVRAETDLDLIRVVLIERPQNTSTLLAVEFDVFQLWEYACPSSHYAGYPHEVV